MWFSSIKNIYGERWNKQFIFHKKNFTPHRNLKSPGYVKVINWNGKIGDCGQTSIEETEEEVIVDDTGNEKDEETDKENIDTHIKVLDKEVAQRVKNTLYNGCAINIRKMF